MAKRKHTTVNEAKLAEKARAAKTRRSGEVMRGLSLPETTAGGFPCVKLIGDAHVEVENHRGILELSRNVIRLYTSLGILRIAGEGLEIRNADRNGVLIDGRICLVEYEKC